jgi:hypothetical protein
MNKLILLVFLAMSPIVYASDAEVLRNMLDEFLAGASVGDVSAHEKFWDDNLVYTSSSGTRTDKSSIVEGMRQAAEDDDGGDASGPAVIYSAEDVDIDVYGGTAVVAFKLVGTPQGESNDAVAYYFNTGTFIKSQGSWKVVAWQATRIPDAEE